MPRVVDNYTLAKDSHSPSSIDKNLCISSIVCYETSSFHYTAMCDRAPNNRRPKRVERSRVSSMSRRRESSRDMPHARESWTPTKYYFILNAAPASTDLIELYTKCFELSCRKVKIIILSLEVVVVDFAFWCNCFSTWLNIVLNWIVVF